MAELATKAAKCILDKIYNSIKTYLSYIQNYEENLNLLSTALEKLCEEKKDVDDKVKRGKVELKIPTYKAETWLGKIEELSNDEEMKKLMIEDMGIAKAMLRLMKNADLKTNPDMSVAEEKDKEAREMSHEEEWLSHDNADNTSKQRNCCCCVISFCYFCDRHDMSVAAEDMLNKITAIIKDKPGDKDLIRRMGRAEMKGIPTNFVGLESRNELVRKIVNALASNDVQAVGIYGMGGSGKTMLAKVVANSKANGIFEETVMVEISESPNIESIQNQIGDGLGLKLHYVHGISEKAIHLYNRLKKPEPKSDEKSKEKSKEKSEQKSDQRKDDNNSKKTLIVLDNIWEEIDLLQIGIPREYCKLLLTSRRKNVFKAMDVLRDHIFEVGLLKDDEAENLFKVQFQRGEVTGEYKSVADRLLEKCGGLPLSIVATANSLKGKELPLWRQFAEELEKPISCQITGARYGTFSILRTSYELMESEDKKKFFLLACLSPIGSSISIDNLMRYGIGLDLFQHVNKLSEAIELARTWAEELLSSSMLLKGDSNEYVKIHDVVRESTMSFASKSGINTDGQMFLVDAIPRWICEETFNKYTGISLLAQANFARLRGVKANLLQILLLKGNRNQDSFLESNFFQGMTNLKVLEVLFMNFEKGLPESMGKLKVLQTLNLVECKLGDIKLIGELESLLVLSLRGSSLEGLPDEIGKLHKLRLLDMSKCRCKEPRIPPNVIARLSLLEGLYLIDSSFTEWAVIEGTPNDTGITNGADMDEFNRLEFLNVLEIRMLGPISLPISAQFVENLDKFQVIVGQKDFKLKPCQRALIVSKFDVSQELKKDNCLKALLKKADFLALESATVNNIVPELDEEGYRDLSRLQLSNIDSMRRICEEKAAPAELFYNLGHLKVSKLKKLEVLLPVNPLPRKMTTLKISYCNSLTYIFSEDNVVNKESDIIKLPCLKKLKLDGVSNLISMVKPSNNDDSRHPSFFNSKVTLTSLEELSLYNNKMIVKLLDKESNPDSFQNLKVLKISFCEEMENIGTPSMLLSLEQLESLIIKHCKKMEQVISDENEKKEQSITLPNLKLLRISYLEKLKCFYGGSSTAFFPKTVTLTSLEELWLYNNKRIVKLWDKDSNNLHSFKNLKVLRIIGCEEMESIGSPSMFLSLVQLETLTIRNCLKMQQVISDGSETQEIITFPKLSHLHIGNMEKLDCFYGESYKMAFPCLKELTLYSLKRMTKFAGGISSTTFFPKTIEFPCLERLQLERVSDEVRVLWELHEGEGQGISSNPLPNLKTLKVVGEIKLPSIVFPSLSNLHVELVGDDAKFLFSSSSSENERCLGSFSQFPKLEQLTIKECPNSVQQLVNDDDDCGEEAMLNFCGHLRSLDLQSALNMEVTSLHLFKSLRQLFIKHLTWEYLFSADGGFDEQLQSLEKLYIKDCPNMKVIIQGGDKDKALVFPRLRTLFLWNLKGMTKLCSISDIPFQFPSLDYLNIHSCTKLESLFCGEPNQVVELPVLEQVTIEVCDAMKSFSTRPLKAPKLRKLKVSNCPEMEWLLLGNTNCSADLELPSLEKVTVVQCPNMKSFSPGVLRANLRELEVSNCPEMEWFLLGNSNCNADLELLFLENVAIKNCPNMKSFLPALLRAPSLRYLSVAECNKWEWLFDGQPNQVVKLPALEIVTISDCDSMKSFSTIPLKAPKLEKLEVSNCPEMEWLLLGNTNCSADLELLSLEDVTIKKCPNMKSFSPGVLRAPKLQCVTIDDEPYPIDETEDLNSSFLFNLMTWMSSSGFY